MTHNVATLVTENGLLIFLNGTNYTIAPDHVNHERIKEALRTKDYAAIPDLADVRSAVRNWLNSTRDMELSNDRIALNGFPFSEAVTNKVFSMIESGATAEPLANFLRKVRQNPSKAAQDELLLFCVANGFMIHEDGDIIAYKSVRGNYTDIHSGTFNNAVGQTVSMERYQVDDDRNRTCSTGLHFASFEYASTWAGTIDGVDRRLMVMKINPKNVVSIPSDYNNQKGRCSQYTVISEIGNQSPLPPKEVYTDMDLGIAYKELERRSADAKARTDKIDRKRAMNREIGRKCRIRDRWSDILANHLDTDNHAWCTNTAIGYTCQFCRLNERRLEDNIREIQTEIDDLLERLDEL